MDQQFFSMKKDDQYYGDQVKSAKTQPKRVKEKHKTAFTRMKVEDVLAMNEENDLEYDYS